MHVPNPPIDDRLLGGLVGGIESLMKTDHEGNVTVGDGSHCTVDLVEVEAHRFLTEDSDTCLSGSADVVHVGRRARADGDGTKVRSIPDVGDIHRVHSDTVRQIGCPAWLDVRTNEIDHRKGFGDRPCVNRADATASDDGNFVLHGGGYVSSIRPLSGAGRSKHGRT